MNRPSGDETFRDRYGPWAVILGASEGLGAAFADEAAARGCNVVMAARRGDVVAETAAGVSQRHGVETRPIAVDLSDAHMLDRLRSVTDDVDVGLAVVNAALGYVGPWVDHQIDDQLRMLDLCCRTALIASRHFGVPMVERGRGGLVFMSSGAGLAGSGGNAVYSGVKAFDLVFAEALWAELDPVGVDALGVIGPAIDTPTFRAEGFDPDSLPSTPMAPADAAREIYDALGSGPSFVPGDHNREGIAILGSLPREEQVRAMTETHRALIAARDAAS